MLVVAGPVGVKLLVAWPPGRPEFRLLLRGTPVVGMPTGRPPPGRPPPGRPPPGRPPAGRPVVGIILFTGCGSGGIWPPGSAGEPPRFWNAPGLLVRAVFDGKLGFWFWMPPCWVTWVLVPFWFWTTPGCNAPGL